MEIPQTQIGTQKQRYRPSVIDPWASDFAGGHGWAVEGYVGWASSSAAKLDRLVSIAQKAKKPDVLLLLS